MLKMEIKETNGEVAYKISKGEVTLEKLTQILFTVQLASMNQILDQAHADDREKVKGYLYDALNQAASRTLEQFAPEYELRPNLTAKAILEAENNIVLENRLDEVEPGT